MRKPHLVLSAVNLTEGGPLTILRDCLAAAKSMLLPEWKITVLVHDAALIDGDGVDVLAFPEVKAKWSRRMLFEWIALRRISRQLDADLWLSLHDITPVVSARRQAVYCHNPALAYKVRPIDLLHSRTLVAMRLLYSYLYRINIHRNDFIIVQHEWLRKIFEARYGVDNVIVAYPKLTLNADSVTREAKRDATTRFFFPALPRPFKNLDVLFAAGALLWERGVRDFEINVTVTPTENAYIGALSRRYPQLACIRYLGRITYPQVQSLYKTVDAVLFPSTLETWGLPISEAKSYNLPLICADLPYAHETVGNYDNVAFCAPHLAEQWAERMLSVIEGRWQPQGAHRAPPAELFAADWDSLLRRLTDGL